MEQKQAIEYMKAGENVFLTGVAGTGKTTALNEFIEWAESEGKAVAITASTGIAATHIDGITIHSWSGLGISSEEDFHKKGYIENIAEKPWIVEAIGETDILIIDEISMLHGYQLDAVDIICRIVKEKDDVPFGGIQVIVCGDFMQLPPVSKGEIMYAFEGLSWEEARFKICYLTQIYRQDNLEFIEILNSVRMGKFNQAHFDLLKTRVGAEVPMETPTNLWGKNKDVDAVNGLHLDKIDEELVTYEMRCMGEQKYIDMLKKGCMSPETLELKKGAVVLFTKNNFGKGYANGTFGTVVDFEPGATGGPIIQLLSGKTVIVEKECWRVQKFSLAFGKMVTKAQIFQFPLRLAFAITCHKSQGMTLDCAKMELSNMFAHNMGYVALSRVRDLNNVCITSLDKTIYNPCPRVMKKDQEFREASI